MSSCRAPRQIAAGAAVLVGQSIHMPPFFGLALQLRQTMRQTRVHPRRERVRWSGNPIAAISASDKYGLAKPELTAEKGGRSMSTQVKSLQMMEKNGGKVLDVQVRGRLTKEDYEVFVPEIERLIQLHGKLRILLYMHDFEGWSAGALWEDVKFDLKHFNDIERLALVGESKWQKGMAVFCKPFTTAKVRYFDHAQLPEAHQWIEE
jgi:hypothetical protein